MFKKLNAPVFASGFFLFVLLNGYFCVRNYNVCAMAKANDIKDNRIDGFEISMLPSTGRELAYGDKFVLNDNLDGSFDRELLNRPVYKSYGKTNVLLLMFCVSGELVVNINTNEYSLSRGSVVVVLPGDICMLVSFGIDCRVFIIVCSDSEYKKSEMIFSAPFRNQLIKSPVICLTEECMAESIEIYRLMRRKIESGYPNMEMALFGYLKVIEYNCQYCYSHLLDEGNAVSEVRSQQIYEHFIRLVQMFYTEHRNVGFYADKICISPKYLSQVVFKVSKRYAKDWIKDYVIFEAKTLLRSGEYTVQQISDRLNFPNASFFGKYFKSEVGCSPRKFMTKQG